MTEVIDTFACFGSTCAVVVDAATTRPRRTTPSPRPAACSSDWHDALQPLRPGQRALAPQRRPARGGAGEPAHGPLRARRSRDAAEQTGGLVDATLLARDRGRGLPRRPRAARCRSRSRCGSRRARRPARPSRDARWRRIAFDRSTRRRSRRPPGVALDSGGLAKGLFADVLAERARVTTRVRGRLRRRPAPRRRRRLERPVAVAEPVRRPACCTRSRSRDGGVATSGIGRRSWLDARRPRPPTTCSTPRPAAPAFTGVVQATALAPTAARGRDPREGGAC